MDLEEEQPQNLCYTTGTPANYSVEKESRDDDALFNKPRNGIIYMREYKTQNPFTMKGVERRQINQKPTAKNSTRSNVAESKISNAGQSTTIFHAFPEKKQTLVLSCVKRISHNNYEIQVEQLIRNRNIQQGLNSEKKFVKMLIILAPDKQRLITFDLPPKSCTLHNLLKQVEVPFNNDTVILCTENPGANIEFIVTVGFGRESSRELISKVKKRIKMSQQEDPGSALADTKIPLLVNETTQGFPVLSISNKINENNVTIKGFPSVCRYCGFCGNNNAKCERCKMVFKAAAAKPKFVPKLVRGRQKQIAKPYSIKRVAQSAGLSSSTFSDCVAQSAVQQKPEGDSIKAPEHIIALSSSLQKISHNNYNIQTRQLLINRSIQQVKNSDWKTAKMSVILPSAEQRLISFTLPRKSCTVQELLKQVGVPFDDNTTIECVEKHGAKIEFIVTVGIVEESSSKTISKGVSINPQQLDAAPQTCPKTTTDSQMEEISGPGTSAQAIVASTSFDGTKENFANKSRGQIRINFINGFLAICPFCGFCGHDHSECERCNKVFIESPRRMLWQKVVPKAASSSKESTRIKVDGSEPVILTLSSDDERDDELSHSCVKKVPCSTVSTADKTFIGDPGNY